MRINHHENPPDAVMARQIRELSAAKNAVILAHVYQRPEIQAVADCVADSLALAQYAQATTAEIIVMCGVYFMAETAAILAPTKTVLLPDINAGCDMANMLTLAELLTLKAQHPQALVVTYVNSTVEIKAHSDICCTSANALAVVKSLPADREIIFIPDRNLGAYIAHQLKRKLILWDSGFCPVHNRLLPEFVERARREHPQAKLVMHPEARLEILLTADYVASTTGIIEYCRQSEAREFIIGTEIGVLPALIRDNPRKQFYPLTPIADCPAMKLVTLPKLLASLEKIAPRITVAENIADGARRAIEKMLAVKI